MMILIFAIGLFAAGVPAANGYNLSATGKAFEICGSLEDGAYQARCAAAADEKGFNRHAVEACAGIIDDDYNKTRCVEAIAGKNFNRRAAKACGGMKHEQENSGYYIVKCLAEIAGKILFNAQAIEACGSIEQNYYKYKCLGAIAEKFFNWQTLEACAGIEDDFYKVKCFKSTAKAKPAQTQHGAER